MTKVDITKFEVGILFFLSIWMMFTSTNVNQTLGEIYVGFCLIAAVFIILDPKRQLTFRKESDSFLGNLLKGALGYVVLILGSNYIIVPGVSAIRKLLGATSPALSNNATINLFNFGGAIPYIETLTLMAVALDICSSVFDIGIKRENLKNVKTWILIFTLSLIFMFFHLTAKSIENIEVLTIVFYMAIISLVLIIWDESYESAIYLHIIANTLAIIGI